MGINQKLGESLLLSFLGPPQASGLIAPLSEVGIGPLLNEVADHLLVAQEGSLVTASDAVDGVAVSECDGGCQGNPVRIDPIRIGSPFAQGFDQSGLQSGLSRPDAGFKPRLSRLGTAAK